MSELVAALNDPTLIRPADIPELCQRVETEALATDDATFVVELHARWSALTKYLRMTSSDGVAQAQATKLRLFARLGELTPRLPPANQHTTPAVLGTENSTGSGLDKSRLTEARKLAAHPEVVNDVITDGTDDDPPSKAKALRMIDEQTQEQALDVVAEVDRLIKDGLTQAQIGDHLGLTPYAVQQAVKALKPKVDKDDRRRLAMDRFCAQCVGLADAAEAITDVPPTKNGEVARWTDDLTRAIRTLNQLRSRIKEKAND